MAHDLDTKEKAFGLYVQGSSMDDIGKECQVNRKTVIRWKRSEGWDVRKQSIISKVQSKSDKKQVDFITDLYNQTVDLRNKILDQLDELHFKSKEGAISAYQSLTNQMLKFMPQKQELKDEALKKIFTILFSHPRVGPVIEKYKDEILTAIDKELKQL
jgi:transposase